MESMDTGDVGTSPQQQRLRALDRANHIRVARSALKRRLRAGETTPAEAILRGNGKSEQQEERNAFHAARRCRFSTTDTLPTGHTENLIDL